MRFIEKMSLQQSYEEVPYPNLSHSQTHPSRLETIGRLLGMQPAPVEKCRVLDLGCGGGGNLLPMAEMLPESTFVGVDFSPTQILEGYLIIEALGLQNITLYCMDVQDITADFGEFDYIIAHGLFSWVPAAVREKVLAICRQNLAPQGIAYISYNTYPGWHMIGMARRMMLYHTAKIADPQQRAEEARAFIRQLGETTPEQDIYGTLLTSYTDLLQVQLSDSGMRRNAALLHDELEEFNTPFYFHEFAEMVDKAGLQYLAEAEFYTSMPNNFPAEVFKRISSMSKSIVDVEQYMDFLRNRSFRKTLICHAEVALNRTLKPTRVMEMAVASRASLDPEMSDEITKQFKGGQGVTLKTDHAITQAAFAHLIAASPAYIPFDDLLKRAAGDAKIEPDEEDAYVLAANLLQGYCSSADLVDLRVAAPQMTTYVLERPHASHLARHLALSTPKVTNLRHERVDLDGVSYILLPYLDGSRDHNALVEIMLENVRAGVIELKRHNQTVTDENIMREMLSRQITASLEWMAKAALLQA